MIRKLQVWITQHPDLAFGLSTAIVAILAYGLFIPVLGMYGDDPNFLWAYHRGGAAEYKPFMAWIRDFGYLLYQFLSPIFGESVLPWRITTLVLRWTSSLLFYLTLKKAFPKQINIIMAAGFFFLLYPGFSQQAIPVEFILHFLSLNLILGSFLLTQVSIQSGRRRLHWMIPALILEAVGLFICEYFAGLELLRPVLIWQALSSNQPQTDTDKSGKIKKTLAVWLPYLLVFAFFLYWRVALATSTYMKSVVSEGLSTDPIEYLGSLIQQMFTDLRITAVDAWLQIFKVPPAGTTRWLYYAVLILVFSLVFLLLKNSNQEPSDESSDKKQAGLLMTGLLLLLAGGLPVWAAGLKPTLSLFWDRLTLSFMWGACVLLAAFLSLLIRRKALPVLLAVLIAVMTGYQFQLQNQYRKEWDLVQSYFWQLAWRAPDIEANTLIIGDQFPFQSLTDNSLNALLNWNYESPDEPARESYKIFQASNRIGLLNNSPAGTTITHDNFSGTASDAILLYSTPSTCLKVLSPQDRDLPFLGIELKQNLWRANPSRILPETQRQIEFESFMGAEPAHTWCYFFEKGELAAQQDDWAESLRIGKEAEASGYQATTMIEMKTFLWSALIENDIETAVRWSEMVTGEKGNAAYFLRHIDMLKQQFDLTAEAERIVSAMETVFLQEQAEF